ncbi:hypothetical protein ACHHYP_14426 [Achlya hypogyna]|uniref:EF-hand domain-containing protein n=1 Tax=Achlya hypogyna TaxID=1202772 RepID=A0A1V9YD66_ACHHY|nr:hypothetical protein ACHHYP_14426 [Achlya hypogyna]
MQRLLASDGHIAPLTVERVLLCTLLVIIFVVLLEAGLHQLTHLCKRHHKYYEMLTKTTGELMIVGLIYLLVKCVTYFGIIQAYGVEYYSMDAADMLIFFVAIFLVAQSLVIFTRLRTANKKHDALSITSAAGLVHMAKDTEDVLAAQRAWWCTRRVSNSRIRDLCEHKLLEAFFHDVYDLPHAFSFAKYLREIQDSLIADLIEIDVTTWGLLLVLMAAFFGATGELQAGSVYRNSFPPESEEFAEALALEANRPVVLGVFATALTFAMSGMLFYLKKLNHGLVKLAQRAALGHSDPESYKQPKSDAVLDAVRALSLAESLRPPIAPKDAIEQMRRVSNEMLRGERRRKGLFRNNLLVQMVQSFGRKCTKNASAKSNTLHAKVANLSLPLPFSRKAAQFFVQFFLIVNGLYYGMLVTCVVPSLHGERMALVSVLLVPLLVNTVVLAPRLVRDFALLDGTWRVDAHKLSRVIDHLNEVEELKDAMVHQVHLHLDAHGQTVDNIRAELAQSDLDDGVRDGYVDIDAFRDTLTRFGFKLSRHKFHTLVLLEYQTQGTTVKYDDLFKTLAQTSTDAA